MYAGVRLIEGFKRASVDQCGIDRYRAVGTKHPHRCEELAGSVDSTDRVHLRHPWSGRSKVNRSRVSGIGYRLSTADGCSTHDPIDSTERLTVSFNDSLKSANSTDSFFAAAKHLSRPLLDQARAVGKVDYAIHRINHYPVDSVVCFPHTYRTG